MMNLICLLLFSFYGQGQTFHPDDSARRIQETFLVELQKQGDPSKYSEIDSFLQTLSSLRLSCKIELRDRRDPRSCLKMVKWKEKLLNHSAEKEREELLDVQKESRKKEEVLQYIESRKRDSVGMFSE